MTGPSGRLRISDAAVVRDLGGELVILDIESGTYFGLDPVGTRIWQLIEEHGDVAAIVRALEHEFDADAATLRADVDALVKTLVDKKLVTRGG